MTNRSWVTVAVPLLSLACGVSLACSALQPAPETGAIDIGEPRQALEVQPKSKKAAKHKAKQPAAVMPRKVGDYFVHRFSGSFRSGPLTLTERVVSATGDRVIVDYTLDDGETDKTLRVELDRQSERALKVLEVSDSGMTEVPLAAYEAMLEQTVFVPDSNEALLGETKSTCLVGPAELACETKQYRVLVGDREAKLSVTHSAKIPGRDIGGEVTAVDGSVIYRAELLETGNTPPAAASVAVK